MPRLLYWILAYVALSCCVLLGTANPLYLDFPLWAQLTFAALAGLAVGGLAPRALPTWGAWLVLAAVAWIGIRFAPDLGEAAFLLPVSMSAGLAAGLIAWRLPYARRFWRPVPLFAGAAVVVGLVFYAQPWLATGSAAASAFHPFRAPAYTLHMLDGNTANSKGLEGRTVVLAFWATWCGPCREELPNLQKLYAKRYRDNPNVAFYLVDLGDGVDTRAEADAFLKQHGITIPSAFDAEGQLMDALRLPRDLPTRVVIDAQGTVIYRAMGYGGQAGFPELRAAIADGNGSPAASSAATGEDKARLQNR